MVVELFNMANFQKNTARYRVTNINGSRRRVTDGRESFPGIRFH